MVKDVKKEHNLLILTALYLYTLMEKLVQNEYKKSKSCNRYFSVFDVCVRFDVFAILNKSAPQVSVFTILG